ncbi:MAG: CapA family protein [Clostridia bacterium]|nr:CapA family protein [Clostridia bacterium]
MKLAAAGDAIIGRIIQPDFKGYDEIAPYLLECDGSFFNLETTLNEPGECCASQLSGGTYIRTTPKVLPGLRRFGFNMTSFNNNHALDFSYDGLLSTLEALEDTDFVHAGVGRNLAEASAPRYLDTNAGRIALIAVNTTFSPDMLAGEQNARVPGRPGINGLRVKKYVRVTEKELEFVRELADKTGINVAQLITAKEGYNAGIKEGEAALGDLRFVLGDKCEYVMELERVDVERVKRAIYEAQLQADYIMVSIHSHQLSGDAKENPSQFLVDFAHECIDAGAHAIIGHGPHLLRPIEVYKDCPIFYSLGDFILQLYNIELAPAEFYAKVGVDGNATVHELLKTRSADFTRGLMTDPRMFLNVIPLWETEGGKLKSLRLIPLMGNMDGNKSEIGLPRICDAEKVVSYLGKMSEPYGVRLEAAPDGLIDVKW